MDDTILDDWFPKTDYRHFADLSDTACLTCL